MRLRTSLVILALVAVLTAPLSAAGTVAVTRTDLGAGITKYTLAWTSTAGGAISGNPVTLLGGKTTQLQIVQVRIVPGTAGTQPSDLYDVTLVDADGIDLLAATGANQSNALGSYFVGVPPVILSGATVDLVVANAGAAKTGTVEVWVQQP